MAQQTFTYYAGYEGGRRGNPENLWGRRPPESLTLDQLKSQYEGDGSKQLRKAFGSWDNYLGYMTERESLLQSGQYDQGNWSGAFDRFREANFTQDDELLYQTGLGAEDITVHGDEAGIADPQSHFAEQSNLARMNDYQNWANSESNQALLQKYGVNSTVNTGDGTRYQFNGTSYVKMFKPVTTGRDIATAAAALGLGYSAYLQLAATPSTGLGGAASAPQGVGPAAGSVSGTTGAGSAGGANFYGAATGGQTFGVGASPSALVGGGQGAAGAAAGAGSSAANIAAGLNIPGYTGAGAGLTGLGGAGATGTGLAGLGAGAAGTAAGAAGGLGLPSLGSIGGFLGSASPVLSGIGALTGNEDLQRAGAIASGIGGLTSGNFGLNQETLGNIGQIAAGAGLLDPNYSTAYGLATGQGGYGIPGGYGSAPTGFGGFQNIAQLYEAITGQSAEERLALVRAQVPEVAGLTDNQLLGFELQEQAATDPRIAQAIDQHYQAAAQGSGALGTGLGVLEGIATGSDPYTQRLASQAAGAADLSASGAGVLGGARAERAAQTAAADVIAGRQQSAASDLASRGQGLLGQAGQGLGLGTTAAGNLYDVGAQQRAYNQQVLNFPAQQAQAQVRAGEFQQSQASRLAGLPYQGGVGGGGIGGHIQGGGFGGGIQQPAPGSQRILDPNSPSYPGDPNASGGIPTNVNPTPIPGAGGVDNLGSIGAALPPGYGGVDTGALFGGYGGNQAGPGAGLNLNAAFANSPYSTVGGGIGAGGLHGQSYNPYTGQYEATPLPQVTGGIKPLPEQLGGGKPAPFTKGDRMYTTQPIGMPQPFEVPQVPQQMVPAYQGMALPPGADPLLRIFNPGGLS